MSQVTPAFRERKTLISPNHTQYPRNLIQWWLSQGRILLKYISLVIWIPKKLWETIFFQTVQIKCFWQIYHWDCLALLRMDWLKLYSGSRNKCQCRAPEKELCLELWKQKKMESDGKMFWNVWCMITAFLLENVQKCNFILIVSWKLMVRQWYLTNIMSRI